ncbi:anti-sigma factor [Amycolatopsis sp. A133]|uniref:anti-sigma factor n=1 Tax=Amycolatopsis sp. A133 TaxID=3064472 RepID=UPI0027E72E34|nr:anti-sigma factor [Amycolatopsis sp. A133]MDQ7810700.1 anti-sigma factor [Amycolatopsis sp. A133]
MTTADAHTLTGAYALDAVTDVERAAFTRHLGECPACAREVAEFRETAVKLAMAATTHPTGRLRSRVLAGITMTRQLPPVVATPTRNRRPWRTRAAVAVTAVAAAAVAGGMSIGSSPPEPAPSTQLAGPTGVHGAPDVTVLRADSTGGGSVVVHLSRQRGEVAVAAQALLPLDTGHAYQVWLIGTRGAQSAGLVPGVSGIVAARLPADVDRIGITTEPAAGSPQPTTPAVARVPLA